MFTRTGLDRIEQRYASARFLGLACTASLSEYQSKNFKPIDFSCINKKLTD
jgi:hypothetical protein